MHHKINKQNEKFGKTSFVEGVPRPMILLAFTTRGAGLE